MTYYDRIQNAIDYIERYLKEDLDSKDIARVAFMSLSTFYRLFFALTGFSVKEYHRQRRVSEAIKKLKNTDHTILDIAFEYGFNSHSTFTKVTKKITGKTPITFRKKDANYKFERINIMDKYVDVKEFIDEEKYPGVKVLKELDRIRVAYFRYYGENPEDNCFKIMNKWYQRSGLSVEKDKVRVYGFNNPSPQEGETVYGYEVWVTIDDDFVVDDPNVKTKYFEGGKYAVCGVEDLNFEEGGDNIPKTWKKLQAWVVNSKFTFGSHQWLEEHTGFTTDISKISGMDLYMPIRKK